MIKNEFEKLIRNNGPDDICLFDFLDGKNIYTPTTQLYGYTFERNTYHLYSRFNHLGDGQEICCLIYDHLNDKILESNKWLACEYFSKPTLCTVLCLDKVKRLYPERCNYKFAREWNKKMCLYKTLPFTTYNDDIDLTKTELHGWCLP